MSCQVMSCQAATPTSTMGLYQIRISPNLVLVLMPQGVLGAYLVQPVILCCSVFYFPNYFPHFNNFFNFVILCISDGPHSFCRNRLGLCCKMTWSVVCCCSRVWCPHLDAKPGNSFFYSFTSLVEQRNISEVQIFRLLKLKTFRSTIIGSPHAQLCFQKSLLLLCIHIKLIY